MNYIISAFKSLIKKYCNMYWARCQLLILSLIVLNGAYLKVATANSVFRFGFDFGLNINENSFKTSFKVGDGEDVETTTVESTTITDNAFNTESPVSTTSTDLTDIWSKQAQLNVTANNKLQATRVAVTQLKNEIAVVVGRSDFIAAKVKLMTSYLNKVNAATTTNSVVGATVNDHDAAATNRFLILHDYVELVNDLRTPPTSEEGGERSLDYMIMKLALEKHKLIELQTQIVVDVLQAMETWQTYVKQQLVNVATVFTHSWREVSENHTIVHACIFCIDLELDKDLRKCLVKRQHKSPFPCVSVL